MYQRVIIVVLDSVGIGIAKDSARFGDYGVNTLGNISRTVGLKVPHLEALGLGKINPLKTVSSEVTATANFGKMHEVGDGKDTLTGH